MKKSILIIGLFFLTHGAFSQSVDSIRLSVQDCIEMALENNIELKNSQLDIDKAKATKQEAQAEYFPTVSAQALAASAKNGSRVRGRRARRLRYWRNVLRQAALSGTT